MRHLTILTLLLCTACQAEPAATKAPEVAPGPKAQAAAPQPTASASAPVPEPVRPEKVQPARRGKVYTCRFKTHGTIVIHTDDNDTRIEINGRSLPAGSGSYFYQSDDGSEVVFFGPNMSYWDYNDERTEDCEVR
jgi:hypothetical protein